MATGANTTTTHANFIPELWKAETIDAFEKALVVAPIFDDWSDQFANGGDTVHVPVFKNLTSSDIQTDTEATGATYSPQATTDSTVPLIINLHKYVSVEVTKQLQDFNRPDIVAKWGSKLGYTLAAYFDAYMAQLAATSSAHSTIDLTGTQTNATVLAGLKNAKKLMDRYDVPMQDRIFVLGPDLYNYLLIADKISSIDYNDSKTLPSGVVGRLLGIPVVMSTNLYAVAGSSTTATYNFLAWKYALAYAAPKNNGMNVMVRPGDAHFVNTQLTARLDFGAASVPRDGTNNYGVVAITNDENI